MWYLIVSIPDLCTITYFHRVGEQKFINGPSHMTKMAATPIKIG